MHIVYVGLSTFTIVFLLKYTDGPFDIFYRLRKLSGLVVPIIGNSGDVVDYVEDEDPDTFFALLFKCFWCLSTWVAFFLAIAYILVTGMTMWIFPFLWLSSVGVSGILLELVTKHG